MLFNFVNQKSKVCDDNNIATMKHLKGQMIAIKLLELSAQLQYHYSYTYSVALLFSQFIEFSHWTFVSLTVKIEATTATLRKALFSEGTSASKACNRSAVSV